MKASEKLEQIEAPCNNFPSQITGPWGEQVYWAPVGSLYPVCPDGIDQKKVKKLFDKVSLPWVNLAIPIDFDNNVLEAAARKNEKAMEIVKRESFGDGIPFISISSMPLNEGYFEDYYFICYFASKPYKTAENTYITVGMIGP